MRATLAHNDAFDRGPALVAGFPLALVHLEFILKTPTAVHPVDAGTIGCDPSFQHRADILQENRAL